MSTYIEYKDLSNDERDVFDSIIDRIDTVERGYIFLSDDDYLVAISVISDDHKYYFFEHTNQLMARR